MSELVIMQREKERKNVLNRKGYVWRKVLLPQEQEAHTCTMKVR